MVSKGFLNRSTILKELPYLLLCALVLYPILPHAIQSILLVLFLVFSLFYHGKNLKPNITQKGLTPFFIIGGWFFLLMLTLFYSSDFDLGVKRLIRNIHVVIFPFVFLYIFPSLSKKRFSILSNLFLFAHIFLVFFLLIKCFDGIDKVGFRGKDGQWVYNVSDQGFLELLKEFSKMSFARSRYFINENQITTFFIHKAYLSLGFAWCFFLSINEVFSKNSVRKKIIYTTLAIFFLCAIIYFTSIPNILALLILLPLFIILKLDGFKKKLVFIAVCFLGIFSVLQIQPVKDKVFGDRRLLTDINEARNLITSIVKGSEVENTNVRFNVWSCSYKNIKDNFWLGIGVGDEENVLIECYKSNGCDYCVEYELNTHNYYASILLSGGFFALILFIGMFLYIIYIGFKTKNILLVIFILLFGINLISENMLSRINGVLFYSIMLGILLSRSFITRSKTTVFEK